MKYNKITLALAATLVLAACASSEMGEQPPSELCNPLTSGSGEAVRSASGGVVATAASEPCPAATVAPAGSYLVFFDWDSSRLTPEATQIIATASQEALAGNSTQITLNGHADRSGPDAYNVALSERRARAVAGEMVNNGVPAEAIAITAFGESQPLVPTPDGVREPQNRRVEIVIQ